MNGTGLQAPSWNNPYQGLMAGYGGGGGQASGGGQAGGSWMDLLKKLGIGGAIAGGLAGDIWGANTQEQLNLPTFAGGGYMGQAREMAGPQLQAALSGSAHLGAQELSGLGANLAQMGVSGGGKLKSISNLVQQGQAQRNMRVYADWQKEINSLATQLYQFDMQRRMAEYESSATGTGWSGALSQIGQLGMSFLPLL